MKKEIRRLTVADLQKQYRTITFPEYQREANIWALAEKQRLIDSILRQFDIAALYFYRHEDDTLDCVDGQQRIGAIMSFLGHRDGERDNNFVFKVMNEVYEDAEPALGWAHGKTLKEIRQEGGPRAEAFTSALFRYELVTVILADSERDEDFNLQFTRLNLGMAVISGEKLNAMVGELKQRCFDDGGLGHHPFLEAIRMAGRRFGKEQTAAQIVAQIFSRVETEEYTRTRQLDLQKLFLENAKLDPDREDVLQRLERLLDLLGRAFEGKGIRLNRAMAVSTVVLAWEEDVESREGGEEFADFVDELQCRVRWQAKKGFQADPEYAELLELQRHITQASVEKPAVRARARIMQEQFKRWREGIGFVGDEEWTRRTREDPREECRQS